jgi:hypothetical protein
MVLRSLLDDEDLKRSYRHPDTGALVALDSCLGYYAWHSRHHVAQLLKLPTPRRTLRPAQECTEQLAGRGASFRDVKDYAQPELEASGAP